MASRFRLTAAERRARQEGQSGGRTLTNSRADRALAQRLGIRPASTNISPGRLGGS